MWYDGIDMVRIITNLYNRKRETNMKKKLFALLASALCVSMLFACGDNATTEHDHDHETAAAELAAATVEPTYEMVDVENDETALYLLPVEDYVTLGDYKGLEVTIAKKGTVTDDEVEATAAQYFMEDAAYLPAESMLQEGAVVDGCVALIDFEGNVPVLTTMTIDKTTLLGRITTQRGESKTFTAKADCNY